MSRTFSLRGTSSVLSTDFYPPLELEPSSEYALTLLSLHTYNTIPNIEEGINNGFYFGDKKFDTESEKHKDFIGIPTGVFELTDIEVYLQKELQRRGYIPSGIVEKWQYDSYLSIKPNNNTLKCEVKSVFRINFTPTNSLASVLGFSKRSLLQNEQHMSDIPVNIIKVLTVRIECSIVSGSYYNNKPSHTLYEFAPSSSPGHSINIEPRNLVYLPLIRQRTISNITLKLINQDGELVNFQGEPIVIRLELKKLS